MEYPTFSDERKSTFPPGQRLWQTNRNHGVSDLQYLLQLPVPETKSLYESARLLTFEKLQSMVSDLSTQNVEFSFIAVFYENESAFPKMETYTVQIREAKCSVRDGIHIFKLKTTPFSVEEYNEITVTYMTIDAFIKVNPLMFDPSDEEAKRKYARNSLSAKFGYAYTGDPAFKDDWVKLLPTYEKPKENTFEECVLFLEAFSASGGQDCLDWQATKQAVDDWETQRNDYYTKRAAAYKAIHEVNRSFSYMMNKGIEEGYDKLLEGIENDIQAKKRVRIDTDVDAPAEADQQ